MYDTFLNFKSFLLFSLIKFGIDQDWVANAPRDNIFAMNKEGLTSIIG